jgi:acyl dehydratase
MRIFSDFNEIKSALGSEIGASDWIEVSQERINQFAEATCNEQWIHVDQERAKKELPGGTTIAHGLRGARAVPLPAAKSTPRPDVLRGEHRLTPNDGH